MNGSYKQFFGCLGTLLVDSILLFFTLSTSGLAAIASRAPAARAGRRAPRSPIPIGLRHRASRDDVRRPPVTRQLNDFTHHWMGIVSGMVAIASGNLSEPAFTSASSTSTLMSVSSSPLNGSKNSLPISSSPR